MKKNIFTIFKIGVWIFFVLIITSCFSPWEGNEGILTLYLNGTSNSRASAPPDDTTLDRLYYQISINGPTNISLSSRGKELIQTKVNSGKYNISVKAFFDSPNGNKYAEGILSNVTIKAGQNSVVIAMKRYFPVWIGVADSPFGTEDIYSVTCGNGKFIAGGGNNKMAWSVNGSDWYLASTSPFTVFNAMVFGNGNFVASGTGDNRRIASSPDGINWDFALYSTSNPFSSGMSVNLSYCDNGAFYASEGGNSYPKVTSTDGLNWNDFTSIGSSLTNCFAWGNGVLIAAASTIIRYSLDNGNTWTLPASPFSSGSIYSVAWGNETFVAVNSIGQIGISNDGLAWVLADDSTFGGTAINRIVFEKGYFVAVGNDGKMAYSSDNGITWIPIYESPFGTTHIRRITYGDGRFVAVGYSGKIAYSIIP